MVTILSIFFFNADASGCAGVSPAVSVESNQNIAEGRYLFSRQAAGETPTLPEASAQFLLQELEYLIVIFTLIP